MFSLSMLYVLAVLLICSVQSIHLAIWEPKCSKTTKVSGELTGSTTEYSSDSPTYRLLGSGGETCILLTVDSLIDISYITKLNERADASMFVPTNANVTGTCNDSDAETLVLSFKDFSLIWSFVKNEERWYAKSIKLTYNSSSRVLENAANQGRLVTLSTHPHTLLFRTPVGKSFFCPEETIIELVEKGTNSEAAHSAKLYLRWMRLQAFMHKRDGDFGPAATEEDI